MSAPLTVEALGLGEAAHRVAKRLVATSQEGGTGWCCGLALSHPKCGGRGMTMRMTEVSRALNAAFGLDAPDAPVHESVERQTCNCPYRCKPRRAKGGRAVRAYRLAPELWVRIVVGEARQGRAA